MIARLRSRLPVRSWVHSIVSGMTPASAAVLAFALVVLSVPRVRIPSAGLDSSWSTGVDVAISHGAKFGNDVLFTFGPWGQLDLTVPISLPILFVSIAFSVATGLTLVFVCWHIVRTWLPAFPAAIVVAVGAAPVFASGAGFSVRVLILAIIGAVGIVTRAIPARMHLTVLVWLALLASLSIEVKFSNGVLALGTVLLAAVLAPQLPPNPAPSPEPTPKVTMIPRLIRFAVVIGVAVIGAAVAWIVASQPLSNIVVWFRGSVELSTGYPDAMATESPDRAGYVFFFALCALLVVSVILRFRTSGRNWPLVIVIFWVMWLSLRLGFTRDDVGHVIISFEFLIAALISIGIARAVWLSIVSITLAVAMFFGLVQSSYLDFVDPAKVAARVADLTNLLTSNSSRIRALQIGAIDVKKRFPLDSTITDALVGRTVHVDPYDANVAWAYNLAWRPVPIFQQYSAYTPYLDELNARALDSSRGPDSVLRKSQTAIDGRNQLWDSPSYTLALLCGFRPTVERGGWMVLDRSSNRCAPTPSVLRTVTFAANEKISVPASPGQNFLVVASVNVNSGALTQLEQAVFKPFSSLLVTTSDGTYRLPRALAGGPLVTTLPTTTGWDPDFGGGISYRTLSFSQPGTVTFSAIQLR